MWSVWFSLVGSDGQASAHNARDPGSIPGSGQSFPCTSGTEACVRVLQRPLSGEGGKVASGRDGARLALTRNSEAEASSRQTQALGPGLRPKLRD